MVTLNTILGMYHTNELNPLDLGWPPFPQWRIRIVILEHHEFGRELNEIVIWQLSNFFNIDDIWHTVSNVLRLDDLKIFLDIWIEKSLEVKSVWTFFPTSKISDFVSMYHVAFVDWCRILPNIWRQEASESPPAGGRSHRLVDNTRQDALKNKDNLRLWGHLQEAKIALFEPLSTASEYTNSASVSNKHGLVKNKWDMAF